MKILPALARGESAYQRRVRQYRPARAKRGGVVFLLGSLLMLLSACTGIFATPSQGSGGPLADTTGTASSAQTPLPSPTAPFVAPTITLQVSGGCPALNWDRVAGTRANVNKVQEVMCGALEGPGSFDALIDVRYYSPESRLDFYVYDNLFGAPVRRFGVQGLLNGDALISSAGTLITAEEGPQDIIKGARDLFKEYQWNGSAFAQVSFPGIYPDMTRYQAEHDQATVNSELAALPAGQPATQIQDAWKLAPSPLVSHLAQAVFHWQLPNFTVVVPPDARKLIAYTVTVVNQGSGGGGFVALVHHLNDVLTNILEVWQVSSIDGNASLNSPLAFAQLTSPVSVSGASLAGGGVLGQVLLYDDTFTIVGSTGPIRGSASSGYAQFAASVKYQLNARGLQEGVVAFYSTAQNNLALINRITVIKVFLSA